MESITLPDMPAAPQLFAQMTERNNKALAAAEAEFQKSDLLELLKRNSEEKREACASTSVLTRSRAAC